MSASAEFDAVVVGAGPNGLTAAVTLAEAGCSVLVLERNDTVGGGARTSELTAPGFRHDVCSAVHPLGIVSPAFNSMPLSEHGLEWIPSPVEMAHPLADGTAGVLLRSSRETDRVNGCGGRWTRLVEPIAESWPTLSTHVLAPARVAATRPVAVTRLGLRALPAASTVARLIGGSGGEVFAGSAAHAGTSLSRPLSGAAGLVLSAAAHVGGWPVAAGGSQSIADALVSYLRSLGGHVECDRGVTTLDELPPARAVVCDTTPRQLLAMAGERHVPKAARWRRFRPGAGAFKLDYALDGPMPWTSAEARRAVTVHLGGSVEEITGAEREVSRGRIPERPFVLAAQQSIVDPTRAPEGKHTLWAYCHVPNGASTDMTSRIEAQIDRFAPGWRDLVLERRATSPAAMARHNPNYAGGDIAGGATDGLQMLFRPDASWDPYRTGIPGVWLCSSSTPPGAGVHGLCGLWAARSVLRNL